MTDKKDLKVAAEQIYDFVKNAEIVQEYVDEFEKISDLRKEGNNEEYYKEMAAFVNARRKIGEINFPNYVFRADFYATLLNQERWSNNIYYDQLEPISKQIDKLKNEHGLKEDEFWKRGEGPEEWEKLNDQYDEIIDRNLIEVFHELNFSDVAELYIKNHKTFERLYKIGREQTYNRPTEIGKLSNIVEKYKNESKIALENDAYYSSAIMTGAAIEAILLREVLKNHEEIIKVVESLSPEDKPKSSDPKRWTLYELITVGEMAGWLPKINILDDVFLVNALVNAVRSLRNFLHPGRVLREKSLGSIQENEAKFARSILVILDYIIEELKTDSEET